MTRTRGWASLALGSAMTAGCQWLSVLLVARNGSPHELGVYGLVTAFLTPAFALAGLQLRALMATDPHLKNRAAQYLCIRLAGYPFAAGLVCVAILAVPGLSHEWMLVVAASLARFAELAADFVYGLHQRSAQFWKIGRSQLARAIVAQVAFAGVWFCTARLTLSLLIAGALSCLVVLCVDLYPNQTELEKAFAAVRPRSLGARHELSKVRVEIARILKHSLPLAAVAFLNSAVVASPRAIAGWLGTLDQVAALTCLNTLIAIPLLLTSAYAAAHAPRFARSMSNQGRGTQARMIMTAVFPAGVASCLAGIVLVLFGIPVLNAIFGETHGIQQTNLIPIGTFLVCWTTASVLGTAATAMRRFRVQVIAFSASLCAGAGAGSLLIPVYGLDGACWSLALSGAVLAGLYVFQFMLLIQWSSLAATFAHELPLLRAPIRAWWPFRSSRLATVTQGRLRQQTMTPEAARTRGALRVLHITSTLDVGGVEIWLSRVLRQPALSTLYVEILSLGQRRGELEPQFEEAGIRVRHLPAGVGPVLFLPWMCWQLRSSGPWDVIHSHVNRRSSLVLLAAVLSGIPVRISHSHHSYQTEQDRKCIIEKLYAWACQIILAHVATRRLACSQNAGASLYGAGLPAHRAFAIFPCGLDFDEFPPHQNRRHSRAEFGLSDEDVVIAHTGRFVPEKNHRLLIDVALCCTKSNPKVKFLLLGDGPLRADMELYAQRLGIADKIIFAGNRSAVPAILSSCADSFFFPSLAEGLGMALIEAQVAGLPCFYANHLPREVDLFPKTSGTFALDDSAEKIARGLLDHTNQHPREDPSARVEAATCTAFSLQEGAKQLMRIYTHPSAVMGA